MSSTLALRRPEASAMRPPGARLRPATHLERACFAAAFHAMDPYERGSPERIAKERWGDSVTELVLKAAVAPADRTTPAWAGALAVAATGDFISSLAPLSAGARLLDAAPRLSLDGINTLLLPARSGAIDPALVGWVAEGAPIPNVQLVLANATLGPSRKLAVLTTLTRETAEHGNGETVLTQLLRENVAAALDASLFSNAAATADRPAGILNGVAALTATAAGADAMMTDLSKIAAAVGANASGLAYIAHPSQANAIKLRRTSAFPDDVPVWPTLGVAPGVVIGLDPAAFASAFGPDPEISASRETLVHMETAPAQIGVAGAPNVVAAPSRSMFQTDCINVKLVLRAAWTWRTAGAVAWITGTNW